MNLHDEISTCIVTLATARGNTKTICPSEVARKLWPDNWWNYMQEVRVVAFALRDKGQVRVMQKGEEVFGDEVKGPIRIQII